MIYLLQARPITSLDIESDFELMHEQDGPLFTDTEMFTNANTGEMMPQAMTPLTCDVFVSGAAGMQQVMGAEFLGSNAIQNAYVEAGSTTFCKHFFLNMYITLYFANEYTSLLNTKDQKEGFEIMMFGKPLGNEILDRIHARYRNIRVSLYRKIRGLLQLVISALRGKHRIQQGKSLVKTANTDFSTTDTRMLYQQIEKLRKASGECWYCHTQVSLASSTFSGLIKIILDTGREEDHAIVMSEVANLLSTCPDVLSADVPHALRKIALTVIDSGKAEFFQSLSAKEAAQWLQTDDSGELKNEFARFIETHGHRCVRESELWEKPWRMEPKKVVKTIQAMTKSPDEMRNQKRHMTEDETIASIKVPVTAIKKKMLRYILPIARTAVGQRENGKGIAIKLMDFLRQGYIRLAELLVHEGRLPEEELIFFLRHNEIGKLIKTRSARLINKANRRRKLMPTLMAMQFPEIMTGYPTPIEDDEKNDVPTTSELTGIFV
ncbi:PREDICTED: uncharacterized protein LOC106818110 [Priapulus caudatus]|uniref:Uncharacterized protein LOC106818110 n=1 Tax=Priapulus caudatus TaxID=37621 RepID=A0ABM1F1J8_PRICU|nr:PREDICTED: uncharacterized protein LOC106818110 [Priapulus caudatus]